jgi:hypothetical protein
MSSNYSSGKNSIADCDRCGFRFKLSQLKHIYIRLDDTNIKVCKECWEPDQPQNMQGMYPVDDPQAVRDPRPDLSFVPAGQYSSRDIQWGWDPVGLNNPLQLEGLIDDLEGTGAVGTVTVTTT